MHRFLTSILGMEEHEAAMLLSAAADLRICQIVDPLKTCRMELPLEIAEKYDFNI
jgi:amidase